MIKLTQHQADEIYQLYKEGKLNYSEDFSDKKNDNCIMYDPVAEGKETDSTWLSPRLLKFKYYSDELFYMHPSKFDARPYNWLLGLLNDLEELDSYNEIMDNVFWEPSNIVLKILFYPLKFCTSVYHILTFIICSILKMVGLILFIPFGSLTLVIEKFCGIISQLEYDRNFHYKDCLLNSYIKAIILIFSIITGPFWISGLWGMLSLGQKGDLITQVGGFCFGIMVFSFFAGGGIVTILGIISFFIGHGYVEYNMNRHHHFMTDEDLKILDDGLSAALMSLGISKFLNKLNH